MTQTPEHDCQWERNEGAIKYLGSRQRHILFCKCRACVQASAARQAGDAISLDPEVARRQEFLGLTSITPLG